MRYAPLVLAVLATGAVLVACSPAGDTPSGTAGAPGASAPAAPASPGTAQQPLDPAEALTGGTPLTLGPVTLSVPDGFTQAQEPTDPSARMSTWVARYGDTDGARAGISVALDSAPQRDAAGTAAAAVGAEGAQRGVEDEESSPLTWPGTDAAHFLTYVQDVTVGGAQVPHRAEWVYADLPDGTQVAVGVLAPLDLFDELELHEVLATWQPVG